MLLCATFFLKLEKKTFFIYDIKENLIVIIRCLFIVLYQISLFISVLHVRASKVVIIENLGPIFIMFLNYFIFNQKLAISTIFCTILSVLGVLLVLNP